MGWLQLLAIALSIVALFIAVRLCWAWLRLRSHPHVEPVEMATPHLAYELNSLVREIANAADVQTPSLYIRRASLPNAFVVASVLRPELYLTDELLEQCSECKNSLDKLMRALCHEVAHIRRGDEIPLGLLTLAEQYSNTLGLSSLSKWCVRRIQIIESEADQEAELIFKKLK